MPAPLLYLHVGLRKTGTTYIQNALRDNRAELAEQGIYYPAGSGAPNQRHAVWDLFGRRARGARDDRTSGQWLALTDAVAHSAPRTALLSEEYLAGATVRQARRAVAGFPGHEVHVLVTARDLGRVLPSAWQEDVKNDKTRTWPEYIAAVRDPDLRSHDPARGFWLHHDLPTVVDTWAGVVGADRVHVVTVPAQGAPRDVLLSRFGTVVGFDPSRFTATAPRGNDSLGVAATEVLRRVNERLDHRLNERQYDKVIKMTLQRRLAGSKQSPPLALSADEVAWATAEAQRMIDHLRNGRYPVVGDLEDLLPTASNATPWPDQASTDELLESSIQAIAALAEDYAQTWWRQRRADSVLAPEASVAVRASSAVRAATFGVRRRGADFANHNQLGAAAMRIYLRMRAAERRRGLSRTRS